MSRVSGRAYYVLFENTTRAMGDAPGEVKLRTIGNCMKADPA
jgi:catalase